MYAMSMYAMHGSNRCLTTCMCVHCMHTPSPPPLPPPPPLRMHRFLSLLHTTRTQHISHTHTEATCVARHACTWHHIDTTCARYSHDETTRVCHAERACDDTDTHEHTWEWHTCTITCVITLHTPLSTHTHILLPISIARTRSHTHHITSIITSIHPHTHTTCRHDDTDTHVSVWLSLATCVTRGNNIPIYTGNTRANTILSTGEHM